MRRHARRFAATARAAAVVLFVAAIRAYRAGLSPFFGPCCRFEPSCSAYAEECVRVHGPLHGAWLAARRIGRCHPFTRGGLDPVPPRRAPRSSLVSEQGPAEAFSLLALHQRAHKQG